MSNEWISGIVQMPPKAGYYLVGGFGKVSQARWMPKKKQWIFGNSKAAFGITHWMPLPSPPGTTGEK